MLAIGAFLIWAGAVSFGLWRIWRVIVPPPTAKDYRRSVVTLARYSAVLGVAVIAFLAIAAIALSHQTKIKISIGNPISALILLMSVVLMVLSSTWLLIKLKRLQEFGRIELTGVAIVLFSINALTDTAYVACLFELPGHGPVFLWILILAGLIYGAIVSIRYLLRGREFVRQGH